MSGPGENDANAPPRLSEKCPRQPTVGPRFFDENLLTPATNPTPTRKPHQEPTDPRRLSQSHKMDTAKAPVKLVKVTRVLGRTGTKYPQLDLRLREAAEGAATTEMEDSF